MSFSKNKLIHNYPKQCPKLTEHPAPEVHDVDEAVHPDLYEERFYWNPRKIAKT